MQSTVAGDQVLVTRAEDGDVSVVDPYCPHLGANMIAGGVVKGNCIQCPFHNWSFDLRTGKCTDVPYAKKVLPLHFVFYMERTRQLSWLCMTHQCFDWKLLHEPVD